MRKGSGSDKIMLGDVINDLAAKYPMITVAQTMDKMKELVSTGLPVPVSPLPCQMCECFPIKTNA